VSPKCNEWAEPLTPEIAAAIPPVVYGVWGLLAIVPFVDEVLAPLSERWLGSVSIFSVTQPTGFGILAGGIVLAVMISPLIISVIFEVLSTVPNDLRHASLAVGATQWQTIRTVVLPQVLPGIVTDLNGCSNSDTVSISYHTALAVNVVGDGNNNVVEAGLDEHDALRCHFDFALNNFFCSIRKIIRWYNF